MDNDDYLQLMLMQTAGVDVHLPASVVQQIEAKRLTEIARQRSQQAFDERKQAILNGTAEDRPSESLGEPPTWIECKAVLTFLDPEDHSSLTTVTMPVYAQNKEPKELMFSLYEALRERFAK